MAGLNLEITYKQQAFLNADVDEVLYGGAAGGGKSQGILIDALLYALRYQGSRQLMLRRTYPELEESLILKSIEFYPTACARYVENKRRWVFKNGSVIRFGYLDSDKTVKIYQSAEYDRIFFDELTHFTEFMYVYMHSRLRGARPYPRQIKAGTNPGGVGHSWVKARFIDPAPPGRAFEAVSTVEGKEARTTRLFIPSLVQDNVFLMKNDPEYVDRLDRLPDRERRALKFGDWDAFEGQYFKEFDRAVHVCDTFVIPEHWRIYRALDYGLDMLCCLWIAVDERGRAVVYKELYESDLIVSAAARRIVEVSGEDNVYLTLAPPDLWNRRQETGRSAADIFGENGVTLTLTNNERVSGWLSVKEWLNLRPDEQDEMVPGLRIFEGCLNLIRTLPALQADEKNPSDVARDPHELTHAPDALRSFCVWWTASADVPPRKPRRSTWTTGMLADYWAASEGDQKLMRAMWGAPE